MDFAYSIKLFSRYLFFNAANAGSNRAASSSTSLNTRKLDEDTENLSRKFEPLLLQDNLVCLSSPLSFLFFLSFDSPNHCLDVLLPKIFEQFGIL